MSDGSILNPQVVRATSHVPKYRKELNTMLSFKPPKTKEELITRLDLITGRSLSELAVLAGTDSPYNNSAGKGFAGQLTELYLGAAAGNLSEPDFIELGIELKTLPVGFDLMPAESTFLCMADLSPERFIPFEHSALYHKLKNILFVILLAPKGAKIVERRILGYFFFTPSEEQFKLFEQDYNEFNELILNASAREIDASNGNIIQMRPKGAGSQDYIRVRDESGNFTTTYPRAYYLRPFFTKQLMANFMAQNNIDEEALSDLAKLKADFGIDPNDLDASNAAIDTDIPTTAQVAAAATTADTDADASSSASSTKSNSSLDDLIDGDGEIESL